MNIKLIIAYDGTDFLGWQEGGNEPTIAGTLRTVLEQIYQEPLRLEGASRTDAGVHAEGQVAHFKTKQRKNLSQLQLSLNQLLPKTIRICQIEEAPESFHSTLNALGKEYTYVLSTTPFQSPFSRFFSWHYPTPLNLERIRESFSLFLGTHDFQSLCNAAKLPPKETVCTLKRIDLIEQKEFLRFEIEGDRFLYKMVRNLVGTCIYIGAGKLSLDEACYLLMAKDRTRAGITAPAWGLSLKQVFYSKNP